MSCSAGLTMANGVSAVAVGGPGCAVQLLAYALFCRNLYVAVVVAAQAASRKGGATPSRVRARW
jgi:hypothetical protein